MFKRKKEVMIPVYFINGFLESGKTEFIKYTIAQPYFKSKGTTLLILCEEGELEYGEGLLKKTKTVMEIIEDEDYHDEIPAGSVLRTEPAAGTMLKEGDLVTLYLSKGPEIIYHTMISCEGQSMEWVQLQMEKM